MTAAANFRALLAVGLLLAAAQVVRVNALLYEPGGYPRLPISDAEPLEVLDANPAEVRALVALALRREAAGDPGGAVDALRAAARLAPADPRVLRATADLDLRAGRHAHAFAGLVRLMDLGEPRPALQAPLAGLLAVEALRSEWESLAQRRPAWVVPFVGEACRGGIDPILLVPLVTVHAQSERAPGAEVGCVVAALRKAGKWEAAYQAWLNALPRPRLAEVGYVFNGGFEEPMAVPGFDWVLPGQSPRAAGHAAEFARTLGAAGKRALRVSYNGKRIPGPSVSQYLALSPGRYEFSGLVRLESLQSVQGLHWTLRCASIEGSPTIAQSEAFQGVSAWRRFAFEAVVPAGCAGQALQLEPVGFSKGAIYLKGTAWFDELRLSRIH